MSIWKADKTELG